MSKKRTDLVSSVRALLRYHEVIGINFYPRNDKIVSFLEAKTQSQVDSAPISTAAVPAARGASKAGDAGQSPVTAIEIAKEVGVCHACELHKSRIYPVAGRGARPVRLLIVGDWLASDSAGNLEPGHLFGVEEDLMLSRMLAAINLSPGDVFITNVIKCAIPAAVQPQASHVESCMSYLRRQIVALMPEMICTMGMIAARAVLEKNQPLSSLRGRFHDYQAGEKRTIPVLTTYHPTYLLRNPEMKQAAWADLQLLAKHLGLPV